jgi:hypothetical protein
MANNASGEVVHCPNCKEEVPKTLYCLNCGYPLYKEEQDKEVNAKSDVKLESSTPQEDAVIVVDENPEETKQEHDVEVTQEPAVEVAPEPTVEVKNETQKVEEMTVQTAEPPSISMVEEMKTSEVPVEVKPVEEQKIEEAPPPVVETKAAITEEEPNYPEVAKEPLSSGEEESKIEAVAMVEELEEETMKKNYVPDPLSKDLMENIAKNLSLRMKLVKLYREGVMKEETFTKLFEQYTGEGKIWTSRRDEMLRKLATEIEEIESAYVNASESLELLEIKKSIGDVSDLEYLAKVPAYRWDVDHFDFLVAEKRNKIAYLEDIGVILTTGELEELRKLASLQYNTVDALQISNEESLSSIKESLYEAIKILG